MIGGLAGEYQFKRIAAAGQDRFHDQPDKGPSSHVCEALHYGLMGAGESDILFNHSYENIMAEMEELVVDDAIFE